MAKAKSKSKSVHPWLAKLRREMTSAGDPKRALAQQAYMKSEMPYHGLANAMMRAVCKQVFADYAFDSASTWRDDVLAIWRGAERREERYAAIELVQRKKARSFHTMALALPMLEEMIVTGAWWDYVDALAADNLSILLSNEPKAMRKTMLAWSKDADIWKRRSSIICQLRFKEKTDLELLYACIEPSIANKEFWLRKAIGWALRQYAWTDPKEIARYVKANEDRLSGLSKREALKNAGK